MAFARIRCNAKTPFQLGVLALDRPHHEESWQSIVLVDPSALQSETLEQLAREFVLREQGNDATSEGDLDSLVEKAIANIRKRELMITFDPGTESVGVIHRLDPALRDIQT